MSFIDILCRAVIFDWVCQLFRPEEERFIDYHETSDYSDSFDFQTRIDELEQEIRESERRLAEYQRIIDE